MEGPVSCRALRHDVSLGTENTIPASSRRFCTTDRPATTDARSSGECERRRSIGTASSAARRTVRPAGAKRGPPLPTARLSKSWSEIARFIKIRRSAAPAQPAQIAMALFCANTSRRGRRFSRPGFESACVLWGCDRDHPPGVTRTTRTLCHGFDLRRRCGARRGCRRIRSRISALCCSRKSEIIARLERSQMPIGHHPRVVGVRALDYQRLRRQRVPKRMAPRAVECLGRPGSGASHSVPAVSSGLPVTGHRDLSATTGDLRGRFSMEPFEL